MKKRDGDKGNNTRFASIRAWPASSITQSWPGPDAYTPCVDYSLGVFVGVGAAVTAGPIQTV